MTNLEDQFEALGLTDQMLNAIKAKGFETPTQIQSLVIPRLLEGEEDLIAQSHTGTGKTATFGLPIMQRLERSEEGVKAIILVPTRELAIQAAEELQSFNSEKRLAITAIYGGAAMSEQLRRLSKGVDIVVGTPGRTLDHIRRGTLKLGNIKFLVLDEADEMLNMGFIEDVEEIMSHTPEDRRVMLFSATMPKRIVSLSDRYMRNTEIIKVEGRQLTTDLTEQIYFEVREGDKFDALTRIIDIENDFYGIVFCRTKNNVDETVNRLIERGYSADGLHGDVSQASREKILRKFREKSINILVATDVAARGIDVNNLTHVINYSLPQDSESYVHRIGRTGRAGNKGTAITFITKGEMRSFGFMKRDINVEIKREELPSAQDIVAMKRNKIKNDLREIITNDNYSDQDEIVADLLELYSPEVALGALLRLAFRSELDESNYPEIRTFSVDRKGTTRLFLAVGKRDGYTGRKLVDMIKERCGLQDRQIDDVAVLESYSFVTVPFTEAEKIVHSLGEVRGRPLAEITNDSREGGDRGSRRDRGGDRRERGSRRDFGGERRDRGDRGDRDRGPRRREYGDRNDRSDRGPRRDFGGDRRDRFAGFDGGERRSSERRGDDRRGEERRNEERRGGNGERRTPSVMSTESFDWSVFESNGDNSWGSDHSKGRPKGKFGGRRR
ncbi:MAG: DEAD/DEAH box helicase [Rikenellaceae bacterium]